MKKMLVFTGIMLIPSFVWSSADTPPQLWSQIVSETQQKVPFSSIQKEFNEGVKSLQEELDVADIGKCSALLCKWKNGQKILEESKNIISPSSSKKVSHEQINVTYNQLRNITNNGFYDVSRMLIKTHSLENLNKVFEHFWQCLWQARDLIEYMKLSQQEAEMGLGRSCYNASNLFRRVAKQFTNPTYKESSLDVSERLWRLSVYYGDENALFEAEDDRDLIREGVEREIANGIPQYISGIPASH